MSLTAVRQRLLTINNTRAYVEFDPRETVQLYNETKRYLKHGDTQLTPEQRLSLMEMLFYLSIFCSEDVEAQIIYNQISDTLGEESCKLQVMKATLLQFNGSIEEAIKYLDDLICQEYEYDTDMASYTLLSKKLLTLKLYYGKNYKNNGSNNDINSNTENKQTKKYWDTWIKEINILIEKSPLDPELWWFLAKIYELNRHFDYAIHCLQEVVLIMPFNYIAFAKLAEMYVYYSMITKINHKDKVEVLKSALNNALRSVELSETFLKGWTLIKLICERLKDEDKTRLIKLADKKLKEIENESNDYDRFISGYILSK